MDTGSGRERPLMVRVHALKSELVLERITMKATSYSEVDGTSILHFNNGIKISCNSRLIHILMNADFDVEFSTTPTIPIHVSIDQGASSEIKIPDKIIVEIKICREK